MSFACSGFQHTALSRRHALKVGGLGLLGLTLPRLLRAEETAPKLISSKADGIQVSEHLPKTAQVMDKVTLIRSMTHNMKNHNSAAYYALSGHAPPSDDQRLRDSLELFPGYGSVVDALAPLAGSEMP